MNRIAAHTGTAAALLLVAVSTFMNLRYGMSLATRDIDRVIFAAASIGADILKALVPFYIWAAWQARRWVVAGAAASLWLVCGLYALSSALGFAALSRAEVVGTTTGKQDTLHGLKRDVARKETQRTALGVQEPSRVLALRREAQKQVWRWAASKECRDVTLKETRLYCDGIAHLDEQMAKAEAAEKLDAEVAALRIEIAALSGVEGLDRGDPQAGLISHLSGFKFENVQMGLVLLAIVLVELGSGLGLFVVSRYAELSDARPQEDEKEEADPQRVFGDVAQFVLMELNEDPEGKLKLDKLHQLYSSWCGKQGTAPLSAREFVVAAAKLAAEIGYDLGGDGDAQVVLGLGWKRPPSAAMANDVPARL